MADQLWLITRIREEDWYFLSCRYLLLHVHVFVIQVSMKMALRRKFKQCRQPLCSSQTVAEARAKFGHYATSSGSVGSLCVAAKQLLKLEPSLVAQVWLAENERAMLRVPQQ